MQRTVVLIKPDALQRGLMGEILQRFERKGLKIIGMKMVSMQGTLRELPLMFKKGELFDYESAVECLIYDEDEKKIVREDL